MPVCGPKLSLCGLIISVWGVIQLALMGVFYHIGAVALIEDIPHVQWNNSLTEFYAEVDKGFHQNAYNCWIAALLYLITLAFSAHQFWANNRSSLIPVRKLNQKAELLLRCISDVIDCFDFKSHEV